MVACCSASTRCGHQRGFHSFENPEVVPDIEKRKLLKTREDATDGREARFIAVYINAHFRENHSDALSISLIE